MFPNPLPYPLQIERGLFPALGGVTTLEISERLGGEFGLQTVAL